MKRLALIPMLLLATSAYSFDCADLSGNYKIKCDKFSLVTSDARGESLTTYHLRKGDVLSLSQKNCETITAQGKNKQISHFIEKKLSHTINGQKRFLENTNQEVTVLRNGFEERTETNEFEYRRNYRSNCGLNVNPSGPNEVSCLGSLFNPRIVRGKKEFYPRTVETKRFELNGDVLSISRTIESGNNLRTESCRLNKI